MVGGAEHPSKKTYGLRSVVFAFGCMLALAVALLLPPVAGAEHSEPVGVVETANPLSVAAHVPGARFVHTATTANTILNWTGIDNPLTNENPNAVVLVTQNWNPGATGGVYNDHAIGVWYDSSTKRWAIFNQDKVSMDAGVDFNVLIPNYMYTPADADAFVHEATAANTNVHWTEIDHPLANNNPDAILHVTQNWNPGGGSGPYNDHAIGVWYNKGTKKWAILNQDFANMPVDAGFNVLIPPQGADTFVHTTSPGNVTSNWAEIDHPLTNNNPNAIVLATHDLNPGGVSGQYNNHANGVWYNNSSKRWAIFNQDRASMPTGASFNVLIPATDSVAFVHTATVANVTDFFTEFDHPLTDANASALVFVTQNRNPGGSGGTYNDHHIGVGYNSSENKWVISHENTQSSMPAGAAFNVLIPSVDTSVFAHTNWVASITSHWTELDHPLTNNNPDAILLVTQNVNRGSPSGRFNDRATGVWYRGSTKKWAVFNQDLATMHTNTHFNVMVRSPGADTFVHTATPANSGGHWTDIDHPLSNGNPNALLFVTQNYNPGGGSGVYNNRAIGVWYRSGTQKWAIFNQPITGIPTGASFNVVVIPRYKSHMPLVLRGS